MKYSTSHSFLEGLGVTAAEGLNVLFVLLTDTMDTRFRFVKLKINCKTEWDYQLLKKAGFKA